MSAALKLNRKIEFWQTKKIHVLKNQNKLDDDTYRQRLEDWTGETSSKNLSYSQAITVIESLEAMLKTKTINMTMHLVHDKSKTNFVQKPGGITLAQFGCIKGKAKGLKYTDAQLDGFIKHTIGESIAVEDLKMKQASNVISGLIRREQGK